MSLFAPLMVGKRPPIGMQTSIRRQNARPIPSGNLPAYVLYALIVWPTIGQPAPGKGLRTLSSVRVAGPSQYAADQAGAVIVPAVPRPLSRTPDPPADNIACPSTTPADRSAP